MAYESGALSPKGRARVDRHLRDCAVCQRELVTIQAYEATVDAIRDDRGPELDWSKMELTLEREAQLQAKKHRRGWMLPAVGVVLAAAAAVLLALPSGGPATTAIATAPTYVVDRHPADAIPPSAVVVHAPMYASAVVTLVAGTSEIHTGEAVASAGTGMPLAAGDVIATGENGSLHARLAPGLVVALEPRTELRLMSFDDGGDEVPELALERGRLATHVHQARTVFLAGEYRIEAEVASFVIDFDAERRALTVDVREGDVHIVGPSLDTHVTGPARFPTDAAVLDAATPVGGVEGYDALPTVHVSRTGLQRWELGDVAVRGQDDIAMRVGRGPLTISGWDAHGRLFRASVTVGADGLDLSPDDLQPEAPRVRQGVLANEDIVPVVHQHQRDLQRCYEHELRATPTLPEVHLVARVAVEMTGSVADDGVTFSGDALPETMARCMSQNIETWIFPAPTGGPVTVSIPFGFAPR
jgi:hypothetical protein